MATITHDTLDWYGFDAFGASVHDVIGTRCDPYTHALLSDGGQYHHCCHSNLTRALAAHTRKPLQEAEGLVHDVLNVFMCTGFTRDTGQYFMKASPVRPGTIWSSSPRSIFWAACPSARGATALPSIPPTPRAAFRWRSRCSSRWVCPRVGSRRRSTATTARMASDRTALLTDDIAGHREIGRSGGIRTHDPQSPRLMRYQAALRSGHAPRRVARGWDHVAATNARRNRPPPSPQALRLNCRRASRA